jgi:hypothetical protein
MGFWKYPESVNFPPQRKISITQVAAYQYVLCTNMLTKKSHLKEVISTAGDDESTHTRNLFSLVK